MSELELAADAVRRLIMSGPIRFRSEVELHEILADRLPGQFVHEFILSKGRADFFRPDIGLLIEVKPSASKTRRLPSQLERYMELPEVKGGIVVAPGFKCSIPAELNGKPVWSIPLFTTCL